MTLFERFKKSELSERKFNELALKLQLNPRYFENKEVEKRYFGISYNF